LGLSAELRGDLRAAQASFETLVRDYPSSPRRSEARQWIQEHAREIAALPEPSTPPNPESSPGQGGRQSDFAVQVGAFQSLDGARLLAGQLRDAGHLARIVRTPGPDLARVRVGQFSSREEAEALARLLAEEGWEVTLATDAGREEIIGLPSHPG
jgi:cell division septation protein DedD